MSLESKTVLIVEDDATMRRFITSVLKQQLSCKNIIQANSAEEALEYLNSHHDISMAADLIVSDWEMPRMKGDEFLFNVRHAPKLKSIPFIMVSVRNDKDALITAVQAGVNAYIVKPFSVITLIQKIHAVLSQQTRRVMPRYDAKEQNVGVTIVFNGRYNYSGWLYDISQTGCLVRSPLFKHGIKGAYENATLVFQAGQGKLAFDVEIARIEGDKGDMPSTDFMLVGFQYLEIDDQNGEKLVEYLTALKNLKP